MILFLSVMYTYLSTYLILFLQVTPPSTGLSIQEKILIIAGVVFAAIQAVKKLLPQITGYYALALNAVLSGIGFALTVPFQDLFKVQTILGLIAAIAAAAGAHGTVTRLLMKKP